MKRQHPLSKIAVAGAAASLLVGSAASAAPGVQRVDPLVALSLFGTASSQAAVCAAGAASVAAGAAAVQAAPAQPGCVLPIVDAPVAAPVAEAPFPVAAPVESAGLFGGIGTLPLLLGLAAIAGGLLLLLDDDDDDEDDGIDVPVSPS